MTPHTWLITGGAGYIGAHVADLFLANNNKVVIYDSLYKGLESRIEYLGKKHGKEIPLIVADICDSAKFEEALLAYQPFGVIHAAALKSVNESMTDAERYWQVNFSATSKILEICAKKGIKNFIFSSTAAVYGSPDHSNPIKEDDPKVPISPYGSSKLAAEEEVERFLSRPGNSGTSLRFFNVIGSECPELADNSVENLVPIVNMMLDAGHPPVIYGDDYPTPDGTCIRDFIDVRDIAIAHFKAASSLEKLPVAMNVGTGKGTSVRQIIGALCKAQGRRDTFFKVSQRRLGDAAVMTADIHLITKEIGFCALNEPLESLVGEP